MPFSGGIALLDKPAGITSFAALRTLKKKLGTGKVGHTGTLDKFARGLLVVLAGSYTRLAPFISDMDKRYECVFEFGKETSTLDPEGDVIAEAPLPREDEIRTAAKTFTGTILQSPPLFSAVHVNGKRSYERALRGETACPAARPVTVYAFDITDWTPPFLSCSVQCGKGTYIRSLARDLGQAVSSRAYVTSLARTRVGPFSLAEALPPDAFDPNSSVKRGREFLQRLCPGKPAVVRDRFLDSVRSGKPLRDDFFEEPPAAKTTEAEKGAVLVFSQAGELAAVIEKKANGWAYRFVCA